jgi:hypothetical protein
VSEAGLTVTLDEPFTRRHFPLSSDLPQDEMGNYAPLNPFCRGVGSHTGRNGGGFSFPKIKKIALS